MSRRVRSAPPRHPTPPSPNAALEPGSPARRARRDSAAGAALLGLLLGAGALLPLQRPLPIDLCLVHRLTGLPCPGCGLTRSIACLLHGDPGASLRLHPAGILVAAVLAVHMLFFAGEALVDRPLGPRLHTRLNRLLLGTAALLTVAAWVARFATA